MTENVFIIPLNKKEISQLAIDYSFHKTPYGLSLIASTAKGVCYVGFGKKEPMLSDLEKRHIGATLQEQETDLHKIALGFINNEKTPKLPLHISGTDFQAAVWKALLQIPMGKLSTYKEIAAAMNSSAAVRAIASAIGKNPVSYIIPCHRVIRSNGELGGYFWGLEIKRQMIERERKPMTEAETTPIPKI